jgi:hypothetical protein
MVCLAPKSILGMRPTYGKNTGVLEGSINGKVGSCSLKYGSRVDPENEGSIWGCGFLVVHPDMVG